MIALAMGLTTATAQSVQQVMVKEYNVKNQKTPLGDVGLTVSNAGAVMSDADGRASLRFRTLRAGERVTVRRVEKDGYEVFNRDAVDQWAISPNHEFTLVLCRSDRFRQLRDQYNRVASQSYERQYKQDQQRLSNERKAGKLQEEAYQQQLQALQDQYEQQLEDLENYVDKFARIDLSELTAQEQELVELVQQGRIEEAIALYEKRDYLGQYERETRDIEEIDRAQQQLAAIELQKREQREAVLASINRQVNTYRLAGGMENFAKAGALLKGVADADTTNLLALRQYIEYTIGQDDYDEAERYLGTFVRNLGDAQQELSFAYSNFARCYANRLQYDVATQMIDKAIAARKAVMAGDDGMADASLAELYLQQFVTAMVSEQYEEAMAVGQLLVPMTAQLKDAAEPGDNYWLTEHAHVQSSLARTQVMLGGDIEQAEQQCREAYETLHALGISNDDTHQISTYLSTILNMMIVYRVQEKWAEQIPLLEESVTAYRYIYQRNPMATAFSMYEHLANLADAYVQDGQLDAAQPYMDEAEAMLPQLEARNNASVMAVVRMSLYDTIANYHQQKGDEAEMQSYADRCLAAYAQMPVAYQEAYAEVAQRWKRASSR